MMKACIIGAGPSGITAAKNLIQVGITDFVIYEKSDKVGGNWVYSEDKSHSSVFETTHIISSKPLSEYEGYPMPESYADYPSHTELYEYFNNYAKEFKVNDFIQFNTSVESADLNDDNSWSLRLSDGSSIQCENLIVCNGHHWNPRMPDYEGEFNGEFIHSHDFKNSKPFKDKRVLVIGGGNSACDIAVETSRVSKKTFISMRRGYYFIPKFLLGQPVDQINNGADFVPDFIKKGVFKLLLKLVIGTYKNYGLQKPDHKFLESHPVVNSELLYFIKHGKIKPKVDISRMDGSTVHFKDGTKEEIDVIIASTGYKITFPFLDKAIVNFEEGYIPLYKKVFHPQYKTLFFIGLVQPMGCIWPLSDAHAKLAANYIAGNYQLPRNLDRSIQKDINKTRAQFIETPRHSAEVDYHQHLAELKKELPKNAPQWNGSLK